jgi:tripartite-type tricarboxylate transporter receptor subunit TctC
MTEDEIGRAFRAVLGGGTADETVVLQRIAAVGHIGATTHTAGDPYTTAFKEGQRALALYILGRAGVPVTSGRA